MISYLAYYSKPQHELKNIVMFTHEVEEFSGAEPHIQSQ